MSIYSEQLQVTDRLGRNIVHDPRSRAFSFPVKAELKSVRHPRYVPVYNQQIGCCTGVSALGCLGTGIFYDTLKKINTDWSYQKGVDIYSAATKIDPFPEEYPPTDTGSSGLAVAKVVRDLGYIESYSHAFSFEAVLSALQTRPVITGTYWYDSFFYPDREGIVKLDSGREPLGGHEYVIDEVNLERSLLGFTNSWGYEWGVNGRFYMSFGDFERILSMQGDVTIFNQLIVPVDVPAPAIDYDRDMWNAVRTWANRPWITNPNKQVANALKLWATNKQL